MYNIMYETSRQSRFDARYWMLGAGALGRPRGMVQRGRREEGSGWGTHVYLWRIHFDIRQNQYNIVKLKNKIKYKAIPKKKKRTKINKEQNSTALQKVNVKVEIGRGNEQCDLLKKKKCFQGCSSSWLWCLLLWMGLS